jgi:hypothetical protein
MMVMDGCTRLTGDEVECDSIAVSLIVPAEAPIEIAAITNESISGTIVGPHRGQIPIIYHQSAYSNQ